MSRSYDLRAARPEDAPALLAIYRPFVESTAISFEKAPPSVDEFAARVAKALSKWQWLVAVEGSEILGYAYGSTHRERFGYRLSVEVSAYVDPRHQRRGIGRALYDHLFDDLAALGYCNAYAGITLPNAGSVALHEGVGFERIGVFPRIGYKLGSWHDVAWYHRALREAPLADEEGT
jgi:L-amino acid N-acyltransferase YncA